MLFCLCKVCCEFCFENFCCLLIKVGQMNSLKFVFLLFLGIHIRKVGFNCFEESLGAKRLWKTKNSRRNCRNRNWFAFNFICHLQCIVDSTEQKFHIFFLWNIVTPHRTNCMHNIFARKFASPCHSTSSSLDHAMLFHVLWRFVLNCVPALSWYCASYATTML